MGHKNKALAAVMVLGILMGGCGLGDDDDDDDVLDPVPGATGNLVITAVPDIVLGLMNALLPAPGMAKPSAAGITVLSALDDKVCGAGPGNVDFTPDNPDSDFTATITDCTDENVVINGDVMNGMIGGLDPTCDLPTSMSGDFTGTVDVDGSVFTFTDFGVAATGIDYGSGCDLDGNASFTATLTGKVENSDLDLDIDFGNSLVVDVLDIVDTDGIPGNGMGREVTMTIDGTMEKLDTLCKSGMLTITTMQNLMTSQPNVCPVSGQVLIEGAFGTETVTYDGTCDFLACEIDFDPGDIF